MSRAASDRCVAGVDVGSTLTKVVVYDGALLATTIGRTEADYVAAAARLLGEALERAGRGPERLGYVVATGYGRRRVPFADREITEITCHARGVRELFPAARTIIDIGGQDAKGIKLGPAGRVVNFAMNDKCAAGTGRFLEVMAAALGLSLEELGARGLDAGAGVSISSVCTVFAQQEVGERLAEGVPLVEVLAGLHAALASRIDRMVRRLRVEPEVVLTGGGARNPTLVRALQERLGVGVLIPGDPLVTGALGAALLAREAVDVGEWGRGPRWPDALRAVRSGAGAREGGARGAAVGARGARPIEGRFELSCPGTSAGAPTAGVDLGSLFAKAAVVEGPRVSFAVVRSEGSYLAAAEEALGRALRGAGIARERLGGAAVTGVGAARLRGFRPENEISAAARGIAALCPEADGLIDIGGQSTRVVRLGPGGSVRNFTVSGQCAAGSARLLEVIAHVLGVEVAEVAGLGFGARRPAALSGACAVFAETEAISLLAQGVAREDLVAGLHRSLAAKIVALARGAGAARVWGLAGGGARDAGLLAELRGALGTVLVPPEPLVVAAVGAALLASDQNRS